MMNKSLYLLLFTAFLLGLSGCTKEDESETTTRDSYFFDPRIPGGSIATENSGLAGNVTNLTADVSQLNKITLSWKVPPIYKTLDYEVKVYKKIGNDSSFVLPDPADEYSAAPLYLRSTIVGEVFLDQNSVNDEGDIVVEIEQNQVYTYWVYIHVKGDSEKWSSGVKIVATSKSPEDSFSFPNPVNFWNNIMWELGSAPQPVDSPIVGLTTMSAGETSINKTTGGIASAYSGNVMYYADTANNRVLIYTRGLAYSCDDYKVSDPELYFACIYQYSGAPMTATNVLGQHESGRVGNDARSGRRDCSEYEQICSSITTANSCDPTTLANNSICEWVQDNNAQNGGYCTAYKRCLTAPTKVSVQDNRLFISDAGNNRIVVYSNPLTQTNTRTLPVKGHVKNLGGGITQEIDPGPINVIGKKGLKDQTTVYPIGQASLNNPAAVAVDGNHLYIADQGNNRVVMIKNYKTDYDCETSDDEWGNTGADPGFSAGKCKFYSLLGQKNFFERWSFKDGAGELSPNDLGYDGIKCTNPTPSTTYCDSPYVLYNNSCGSFSTQGSCNANSACNWIETSPTSGTCSLKAEATLRNILDTQNPNRPGDFMGRYFKSPSSLGFYTYKNAQNINEKHFYVNANEDSSITSPLGTSEIKGRVLVWKTNPFPEIDSPTNPPALDKCYAGHFVDNFDVPTSKCHADLFIGQETPKQLLIVPSGGNYSTSLFGLEAINSVIVKNGKMFGVDSSNNLVLYWNDFLNINNGLGIPPTAKVINPNGRINPQTGRYLPVLQGISDIDLTDTNLIYISDPMNSKVYEIRAYEYETPQM